MGFNPGYGQLDFLNISPLLNGGGAGGTFYPWTVSNAVGIWDIGDVTLDTGRIAQFNDRSGNSNHIALSTQSFRAVYYSTGAHLQGRRYKIVNPSGIQNLDARNSTYIWVYRDFGTLNPSVGLTAPNGIVYELASNRPRLTMQSNYTTQMFNSSMLYAPGVTHQLSGGPSYYAAIYRSTDIRIGTNGFWSSISANAAGTATMYGAFATVFETAGVYMPTIALLVYNRALSQSEVEQIVSYYNASTTPAAKMVYCLDTSTAGGQAATTYNQGAVQSFANDIGAARAIFGIGGGDWASYVGDANSPVAGIYVYPNQENIHLIMPQTNNLAANATVSSVTSALSNFISKVNQRTTTAKYILCPITPRNASFTNGQTYDNYDIARLEANQWMRDNATTIAGGRPIAVADYDTLSGIGFKGDQANTTYYSVDQIHLNTAGHQEVRMSLNRAYTLL